MAQVNEKGALDKPLSDKDKVRGKDTVIVWATNIGNTTPAGTPMEVHPRLAAKLIEAGKATDKEPSKKEGGK